MLREAYEQYGFDDTLTEFGHAHAHEGEMENPHPLKAGFYNRFYSFEGHDASHRQNAKRGFNDPMMFVAMTTQPKVMDNTVGDEVKRFSYAMPFELILRTPLESWNPYDLMEHNEGHEQFEESQNAMGRYGTQAKPFHGYNIAAYYAFTPNTLFDGATLDSDPADTDDGDMWVSSSQGNGPAVAVRNSGIHIHLPPIAGVTFGDDDVHGYDSGTSGVLRTRFPVYSTFWEGNATHAEMDGRTRIISDESAGAAAVNAAILIENVLQPKVDKAIS
jgi:hypothetical protein